MSAFTVFFMFVGWVITWGAFLGCSLYAFYQIRNGYFSRGIVSAIIAVCTAIPILSIGL